MMSERMMWIVHADFGIGPVTGFTSQLKCDDPRYVTLQRQQLQIEHQSCMVGISSRYADRTIPNRAADYLSSWLLTSEFVAPLRESIPDSD